MADPHYEVSLTQGAENDLELVHDYLAKNRSAEDADALLELLLERIATLESFPLRGGVPKELQGLGAAEFRQLVFPTYRLIYRVTTDQVLVMVIADGRRDMQKLLQERLLND